MLERRSALATAHPFSWAALTLGEVRNFSLTQVAGFGNFEADVAAIAGALPTTNDQAIESNGRTVFRHDPRTCDGCAVEGAAFSFFDASAAARHLA